MCAGHTRVVQLLLNRGALLHRDHNGRNPLHLAATSGYTQTMELLHSVHSHLLDQVDKDGVRMFNYTKDYTSYKSLSEGKYFLAEDNSIRLEPVFMAFITWINILFDKFIFLYHFTIY